MNSDRSRSWHYGLRACILFGFAMFIVFLVKSDNILYYIAPRMIIYVKLAALGLYAISVYQGYLAVQTLRGKEADCSCDHPPSSSKFKNTILYSLFIIPLLLGFLVPNSVMGSALAAKKGVNLSSSNSVKTPPATSSPNIRTEEEIDKTIMEENLGADQLGEMFKSDQFTELYAKQGKQLYASDLIEIKDDIFIETLTTLDLYMDNFIGKKLEVSGFVYREDTLPENQFVVARFAIQCCSADAAPYGVLVELPRAKNYSDDTWVKVSGIISKANMHDMDILKLDVQSIEKIEVPANPYVYPNYEFEP
ncbi:MAG TPA: TIGR03943 family protein [Bacilli bacterium]